MSDKTLYYASQIAYFQFDEKLKDDLNDNAPITLHDAFEKYSTGTSLSPANLKAAKRLLSKENILPDSSLKTLIGFKSVALRLPF